MAPPHRAAAVALLAAAAALGVARAQAPTLPPDDGFFTGWLKSSGLFVTPSLTSWPLSQGTLPAPVADTSVYAGGTQNFNQPPSVVYDATVGFSVVRFNATLQSGTVAGQNLRTDWDLSSATGAFTLFVAVRVRGPAVWNVLAGIDSYFYLGLKAGEYDVLAAGPNRLTYTKWAPSTPANASALAGRWLIYGVTRAANGSGTFWRTGNLLASAASGLTGPARFRLGGGPIATVGLQVAAVYFSDCDIGEVLLYSRALPTSVRQAAEGFLANKYRVLNSLPLSHPYYPVSPTGTASRTATPTATSTRSAPTPTVTRSPITSSATATRTPTASVGFTQTSSTTATPSRSASLSLSSSATPTRTRASASPSSGAYVPGSGGAPPRAGLVVWLHPATLPGVTGSLAAWPSAVAGGDPSAAAAEVPPYAAAANVTPPSVVYDVYAGYHVVRFRTPAGGGGGSSVGQSLSMPGLALATNASSSGGGGNATWAVLLVARMRGPALGCVLTGAGNAWFLGWRAGQADVAGTPAGDVLTDGPPSNAGDSVGRWVLYELLLDTPPAGSDSVGSGSFYRNGALLGYDVPVGAPAGLRLGGGLTAAGDPTSDPATTAASWSDADVAELLVYRAALPEASRVDAEGYLALKYGLTGDLPPLHPYYRPPSATPSPGFAPDVGGGSGTATAFATQSGSPSTSLSATPTPTPTVSTSASSSASPSASVSPSLSASLTVTPTVGASPSRTTTNTRTGSRTSTRSGTGTRTITSSVTGSSSPTPSTSQSSSSSNSASSSSSATAEPTSSPSVSASSTATHTGLSSASTTATVSRSSSRSGTSTPSSTRSATASRTHSESSSTSVTSSPTASLTASASATATKSATGSRTASASTTSSPTASASTTSSPTASVSRTASLTPSASLTSSATPSGTPPPSSTASASLTASLTATSSLTASATASTSPTRSLTASASLSGSASLTASPTRSPSQTASNSQPPSETPPPTPSRTSRWAPSDSATVAPTPSRTPSRTPTSTRSAYPGVSRSITPSGTPRASASPTAQPLAPLAPLFGAVDDGGATRRLRSVLTSASVLSPALLSRPAPFLLNATASIDPRPLEDDMAGWTWSAADAVAALTGAGGPMPLGDALVDAGVDPDAAAEALYFASLAAQQRREPDAGLPVALRSVPGAAGVLALPRVASGEGLLLTLQAWVADNDAPDLPSSYALPLPGGASLLPFDYEAGTFAPPAALQGTPLDVAQLLAARAQRAAHTLPLGAPIGVVLSLESVTWVLVGVPVAGANGLPEGEPVGDEWVHRVTLTVAGHTGLLPPGSLRPGYVYAASAGDVQTTARWALDAGATLCGVAGSTDVTPAQMRQLCDVGASLAPGEPTRLSTSDGYVGIGAGALFYVAMPPVGGNVAADPSDGGVAMTTPFTLSTGGWVTEWERLFATPATEPPFGEPADLLPAASLAAMLMVLPPLPPSLVAALATAALALPESAPPALDVDSLCGSGMGVTEDGLLLPGAPWWYTLQQAAGGWLGASETDEPYSTAVAACVALVAGAVADPASVLAPQPPSPEPLVYSFRVDTGAADVVIADWIGGLLSGVGTLDLVDVAAAAQVALQLTASWPGAALVAPSTEPAVEALLPAPSDPAASSIVPAGGVNIYVTALDPAGGQVGLAAVSVPLAPLVASSSASDLAAGALALAALVGDSTDPYATLTLLDEVASLVAQASAASATVGARAAAQMPVQSLAVALRDSLVAVIATSSATAPGSLPSILVDATALSVVADTLALVRAALAAGAPASPVALAAVKETLAIVLEGSLPAPYRDLLPAAGDAGSASRRRRLQAGGGSGAVWSTGPWPAFPTDQAVALLAVVSDLIARAAFAAPAEHDALLALLAAAVLRSAAAGDLPLTLTTAVNGTSCDASGLALTVARVSVDLATASSSGVLLVEPASDFRACSGRTSGDPVWSALPPGGSGVSTATPRPLIEVTAPHLREVASSMDLPSTALSAMVDVHVTQYAAGPVAEAAGWPSSTFSVSSSPGMERSAYLTCATLLSSSAGNGTNVSSTLLAQLNAQAARRTIGLGRRADGSVAVTEPHCARYQDVLPAHRLDTRATALRLANRAGMTIGDTLPVPSGTVVFSLPLRESGMLRQAALAAAAAGASVNVTTYATRPFRVNFTCPQAVPSVNGSWYALPSLLASTASAVVAEAVPNGPLETATLPQAPVSAANVTIVVPIQRVYVAASGGGGGDAAKFPAPPDLYQHGRWAAAAGFSGGTAIGVGANGTSGPVVYEARTVAVYTMQLSCGAAQAPLVVTCGYGSYGRVVPVTCPVPNPLVPLCGRYVTTTTGGAGATTTGWSADGCRVLSTSATHVTCVCVTAPDGAGPSAVNTTTYVAARYTAVARATEVLALEPYVDSQLVPAAEPLGSSAVTIAVLTLLAAGVTLGVLGYWKDATGYRLFSLALSQDEEVLFAHRLEATQGRRFVVDRLWPSLQPAPPARPPPAAALPLSSSSKALVVSAAVTAQLAEHSPRSSSASSSASPRASPRAPRVGGGGASTASILSTPDRRSEFAPSPAGGAGLHPHHHHGHHHHGAGATVMASPVGRATASPQQRKHTVSLVGLSDSPPGGAGGPRLPRHPVPPLRAVAAQPDGSESIVSGSVPNAVAAAPPAVTPARPSTAPAGSPKGGVAGTAASAQPSLTHLLSVPPDAPFTAAAAALTTDTSGVDVNAAERELLAAANSLRYVNAHSGALFVYAVQRYDRYRVTADTLGPLLAALPRRQQAVLAATAWNSATAGTAPDGSTAVTIRGGAPSPGRLPPAAASAAVAPLPEVGLILRLRKVARKLAKAAAVTSVCGRARRLRGLLYRAWLRQCWARSTLFGAVSRGFDPRLPRPARALLSAAAALTPMFWAAFWYGFLSGGSGAVLAPLLLGDATALLTVAALSMACTLPMLLLINALAASAGGVAFEWRYASLAAEMRRRREVEAALGAGVDVKMRLVTHADVAAASVGALLSDAVTSAATAASRRERELVESPYANGSSAIFRKVMPGVDVAAGRGGSGTSGPSTTNPYASAGPADDKRYTRRVADEAAALGWVDPPVGCVRWCPLLLRACWRRPEDRGAWVRWRKAQLARRSAFPATHYDYAADEDGVVVIKRRGGGGGLGDEDGGGSAELHLRLAAHQVAAPVDGVYLPPHLAPPPGDFAEDDSDDASRLASRLPADAHRADDAYGRYPLYKRSLWRQCLSCLNRCVHSGCARAASVSPLALSALVWLAVTALVALEAAYLLMWGGSQPLSVSQGMLTAWGVALALLYAGAEPLAVGASLVWHTVLLPSFAPYVAWVPGWLGPALGGRLATSASSAGHALTSRLEVVTLSRAVAAANGDAPDAALLRHIPHPVLGALLGGVRYAPVRPGTVAPPVGGSKATAAAGAPAASGSPQRVTAGSLRHLLPTDVDPGRWYPALTARYLLARLGHGDPDETRAVVAWALAYHRAIALAARRGGSPSHAAGGEAFDPLAALGPSPLQQPAGATLAVTARSSGRPGAMLAPATVNAVAVVGGSKRAAADRNQQPAATSALTGFKSSALHDVHRIAVLDTEKIKYLARARGLEEAAEHAVATAGSVTGSLSGGGGGGYESTAASMRDDGSVVSADGNGGVVITNSNLLRSPGRGGSRAARGGVAGSGALSDDDDNPQQLHSQQQGDEADIAGAFGRSLVSDDLASPSRLSSPLATSVAAGVSVLRGPVGGGGGSPSASRRQVSPQREQPQQQQQRQQSPSSSRRSVSSVTTAAAATVSPRSRDAASAGTGAHVRDSPLAQRKAARQERAQQPQPKPRRQERKHKKEEDDDEDEKKATEASDSDDKPRRASKRRGDDTDDDSDSAAPPPRLAVDSDADSESGASEGGASDASDDGGAPAARSASGGGGKKAVSARASSPRPASAGSGRAASPQARTPPAASTAGASRKSVGAAQRSPAGSGSAGSSARLAAASPKSPGNKSPGSAAAGAGAGSGAKKDDGSPPAHLQRGLAGLSGYRPSAGAMSARGLVRQASKK